MMIKGIMELAEAQLFGGKKNLKVCLKVNKMLLRAMQDGWYFDKRDISRSIRGILSWAVMADMIRNHMQQDESNLRMSISLLRIRSDRLREELKKNESLLNDLSELIKLKGQRKGEANAVRKNKGNKLSKPC